MRACLPEFSSRDAPPVANCLRMDRMMTAMFRSLLAVASASAWLSCHAVAWAAPSAADQLRGLIAESYEAVLRQVGSDIKRGTKEFDEALERTVGAVLAARPEGCGDDRLLADLCGIRPAFVTSSAMAPTLVVRDAVLTVPVTAKRPLERGDIVVFRQVKESPNGGDPRVSQQTFRVIALPGDHVAIRDGVVEVNGAGIAQSATGETITQPYSERLVPVLREQIREGRSYRIARPAAPPPLPTLDDQAEIIVPAQAISVLGDNRHNAVDSRLPGLFGGSGFVREDAIIGRVVSVYASADETRIGQRPE